MSHPTIRRTLPVALCLLGAWTGLYAQEARPTRLLLWPDGAPGAKEVPDTEPSPAVPTLDIWLPAKDKANGAAVVVLPGGGYGFLAMDHEGTQIGEFFNSIGVAAFVVRYRHAPHYQHPIPLSDAQRAIRWVRHHAQAHGVKADRIGVMGFSAGGHLASTVSTHFDAGRAEAPDPVDRVSCRPDFSILCYPVIALDGPAAHIGSRKNLLGENPEAALVEDLSNHNRVTKETPPTFLFHTDEDTPVPPENSVMYYLALRKAGVPAEMHIFRKGPHGVGLALKDPVLSAWPGLLKAWMGGLGLLADPANP